MQAKDKKVRLGIRTALRSFNFYDEVLDAGKIISVKDGVARVSGLLGVLSGEMVHLGLSKIQGMLLSSEYNNVSVVIFRNNIFVRQGD